MSDNQRFIDQNRNYRVSIEYDVEMNGIGKKIQLPFVMGVLADLSGKPTESMPSVECRNFQTIDVDNFNCRLKAMKPRVSFTVPNTLTNDGSLRVDISFESMDDFLPAAIVKKVIDLDNLLEHRTQMSSLIMYMDGKTRTEYAIERFLNNRQLLNEVLSQDKISPEVAQNSFTNEPGNLESQIKNQSNNLLLESIVQEFKFKTDEEHQQVRHALKILAKQIVSNPNINVLISDGIGTIIELIKQIDIKLTKQLNLILHHPELQQLEGAWRGLYYLVSNTEKDELMKIRFMNISKEELSYTFRKYKDSIWNQNPLFKKLYEDVYGQLGGEPYGCLIGDYEFDNNSDDINILSGIAQIAAAIHSPFIAAASPSIMQMNSWQEIAYKRDFSKNYATWRSLRESKDSKYLALVMPRFLARLPYGKTQPVEEFDFQEDCNGGEVDSFVWCNSAYVLGVNITRAFKLYGWCVNIYGYDSAIVEGLPIHTFPTGGHGLKTRSLEVSLRGRRETELINYGLIPFLQQTSYSAAFLSASSLHKTPVYDNPDATANAELAGRLPYILTSCRFAHYLRCIVRDRIGSFVDRMDLEKKLNTWIMQYIYRENIFYKAKKPLADAQIVLDEIEGNPAYYFCRFYVRPYYQLPMLTHSLYLNLYLPVDVSLTESYPVNC